MINFKEVERKFLLELINSNASGDIADGIMVKLLAPNELPEVGFEPFDEDTQYIRVDIDTSGLSIQEAKRAAIEKAFEDTDARCVMSISRIAKQEPTIKDVFLIGLQDNF